MKGVGVYTLYFIHYNLSHESGSRKLCSAKAQVMFHNIKVKSY